MIWIVSAENEVSFSTVITVADSEAQATDIVEREYPGYTVRHAFSFDRPAITVKFDRKEVQS